MEHDFAADMNLRELSAEEAWEAIENFSQGQKEWDNPPNIIPEQELAEVEETTGILMEVEPLNQTQIEDLDLNTCSHDLSYSFREVPSFDEPEPQPHPLLSCPSLEVSLGDERGPEPPIKPNSPDSFRMKVIFDEEKLRSSLDFHVDDSWMMI
ncbi:hypothetical protein Tco_1516951 [Tanacetum coccineum]